MRNTKIENFKGLEVDIKFADIIERYADKCSELLKVNSPDGVRTNNKYREGWEAEQKSKKKDDVSYVVWNKTNYQLTHLFEKGHLIVNKRNGVGWASSQPHIDKSFQTIKPWFERAMEDVDIKVK